MAQASETGGPLGTSIPGATSRPSPGSRPRSELDRARVAERGHAMNECTEMCPPEITESRFSRRAALGAGIALAGTAYLSRSSASAQEGTPVTISASTGTPSATGIPTVLLVHGAFADASGWAGVITELQADGITV